MPRVSRRGLPSWRSGRPTGRPWSDGARTSISPGSSKSLLAFSRPRRRSRSTRSPDWRSRRSSSTSLPGRTVRRWWCSTAEPGSRSAPAKDEESHADPQQGGGDDPGLLGRDRLEALTQPGLRVLVNLERVIGHQPDGPGHPAWALVLDLSGIEPIRLWYGHPRIMGRSAQGHGASVRCMPDASAENPTYSDAVIDDAGMRSGGPVVKA